MSTPRRANEDYYYYQAPLTPGYAASNVGAEEERPEVAAVLWVPNPEQRHNYREFYIYREQQDKPGSRPIGFGK